MCNVYNGIPPKFPSFPYVLVNRSVSCNCDIEAENNFLLEPITASHVEGFMIDVPLVQ